MIRLLYNISEVNILLFTPLHLFYSLSDYLQYVVDDDDNNNNNNNQQINSDVE